MTKKQITAILQEIVNEYDEEYSPHLQPNFNPDDWDDELRVTTYPPNPPPVYKWMRKLKTILSEKTKTTLPTI